MATHQVPEIEISGAQVKNLFMYLDETQNEAVKSSVFNRLGYECFHSRGAQQWIDSFGGDIQAFLDRVNVEQTSPFWESLIFTADRKTLILTGKPVERCACAYADSPRPPKSLCNHCCKTFQEVMFGALFGCEVEVEITEASLLGGQRCSTAIHLAEAWPGEGDAV